MRIFNYSNYAKVFGLGISDNNKTEIAQILFSPLIDCEIEEVLNKNGEMYYIDSAMAKDWYDNKTDIPIIIKKATNHSEMIEHVIDYFKKQIITKLINVFKAQEMYDAMLSLINESNLIKNVKDELVGYYNAKNYERFLGISFLYAINQNNRLKEIENDISNKIEKEIKDLNSKTSLIKKKPSPITPPSIIAPEELGYVEELYKVYSEKTGENCVCEDDLQKYKDLHKNFNNQRKNYYSAETIRRELRDTVIYDEKDDFEILKDEIFDGIIDVRDDSYALGYDRLMAVMKHVTKVQTSQNINDKLLGWVGPSEKKGVCHMLVNDNRIKWMEEDKDEE